MLYFDFNEKFLYNIYRTSGQNLILQFNKNSYIKEKKMRNKRCKKIDLRLSDCEKESIQQTAKKFNMNTSQFIRFACE